MNVEAGGGHPEVGCAGAGVDPEQTSTRNGDRGNPQVNRNGNVGGKDREARLAVDARIANHDHLAKPAQNNLAAQVNFKSAHASHKFHRAIDAKHAAQVQHHAAGQARGQSGNCAIFQADHHAVLVDIQHPHRLSAGGGVELELEETGQLEQALVKQAEIGPAAHLQ